MGNKSCTLGVQTEKTVYFSGDTVNGRVFLSVNDQNGIVAQSLNIHCSGVERGLVHYTEEREGTNNESTRQIERYEDNEIEMLNFDVPINTPIGSLFQKGQYEFPFQFIIPQNLPSSMSCSFGQSKCEIRYEMKAYLSKMNDRNSFTSPFNKNTISSKPIPINIFGSNNTMYSQSNQPVNFPGESHNVRNCCCFHRGKMELRASMDSYLFVPNQNHTISFSLKNNSRVNVENVTVEVIERVQWKPRFRVEAHEFTLDKKVIDGSNHRNWMNYEQDVENTVQEFASLSQNSRMSNSFQNVDTYIPHRARDTYSGRMIQVEHFVRVKVVTQGCCVSNPETTADICISRPSEMFSSDDALPPVPSAPFMEDEDKHVVEATILPPDWSPLTSDIVMLPVANVISISTPEGGSYYSSQSQPAYSAPHAPVPSAPDLNK